KRQKTRKGTRSCWECKRRKVKCTYASPTDEVCVGCDRRCMECVGQEFPEQPTAPNSQSRLVGDRIGRLETMIQQLAEQVGHCPAASTAGGVYYLTHLTLASIPQKIPGKHAMLSQRLLAAYPSPADIGIIGRLGENLALYLHQIFVAPFNILQRGVAAESERLCVRYTVETHPVLIARQMLLLAGILAHADPTSCQQLGKLSRPPQALAKLLAEAAVTLVTVHDKLINNTEGLECLWLEAMYHEHSGSLRQAWLTCRRAISAAQLMGLHRRRCSPPKSIQPNREVHLQQIWFYLVHTERALCFVLGAPSGSQDIFPFVDSATTEDTDTSKLERRHAVIASHILEQCERDPNFEDFDAMHQIHIELEEATSNMPRRWWRTTSLADTRDHEQLFWAMKKLKAQIFHSHLLLHAHLPLMLQACDGPTNEHYREHLLSRNVCVEASRDLLRRFVQLRSCERTESYFRLLDNFAWLAAATLLLTHLDGHQTSRDPGHQHRSDRDMVSKAIEKMRFVGDNGEEDVCDARSTEVLHHLLAIEARGSPVAMTYRKLEDCSCRGALPEDLSQDPDTFMLSIPFIGQVSITIQVQGETEAIDISLSGATGCLIDDEERLNSEDETSLVRAIELRRSAPWQILPYMIR
ncbi:hypothetical protein GQ53DRAFT_591445, partial [Thozetella sp. PMI_491]